ncbi:hypothetical protein PHJA_002190300 [Phtheirospermum japonicum]|uniref:DC1 domain-containing protein n=1 Tax=Phtheirospermum japonicum TaxID=374723 RepID=A0A830CQH9_9LAMI|nr:hypothetical protein PHJA_002190300 [Phtheirospermum japonicum]
MKKQNRHFSHSHALQFSELGENEEDNKEISINCSGCEQQLSTNEPAYFCPKPDCEFYLHKLCFELPKTLDHKSHPDHKLTLLSEPPRYSLYYDCNACGGLINAFSFHCKQSCDFKIHTKCAFLPDTVDCKAHDHHALAIQHCTPKSSKDGFDMVLCDVCDGYVTEGYWSYICKDCDYVAEEINEEGEEEEGEEEEVEEEEGELSDAMRLHRANIQAMDQMARLRFQTQMAEMNARTMAMFFRTTI